MRHCECGKVHYDEGEAGRAVSLVLGYLFRSPNAMLFVLLALGVLLVSSATAQKWIGFAAEYPLAPITGQAPSSTFAPRPASSVQALHGPPAKARGAPNL